MQAELDVVTCELRGTEEAIERYLLAFEAGVAARGDVQQLGATLGNRLATLKQRHADLAARIEDAPDLAPTERGALTFIGS